MSDNEKRAREMLAEELMNAYPDDIARRHVVRQLLDDDLDLVSARCAIRVIAAALRPPERHVPERAILRVAIGLRERASRSARPLERKTLIASAEELEKAVSAARAEVQP